MQNQNLNATISLTQYLDSMKLKILVCLAILSLMSCTADDPKIFSIQNATVVSVTVPDTLRFQQTEIFVVDFINPTTCHTFEGFDIVGSGQTKTIITENRFDETFDCEETPVNVDTAQFEFFVENNEEYTIRFLRGASDTGQLQYFTFEIPVKIE